MLAKHNEQQASTKLPAKIAALTHITVHGKREKVSKSRTVVDWSDSDIGERAV